VKELREFITSILTEDFQSHTFEPVVGDIIVNDNPGCKHKGSIGEVVSVNSMDDDQGKTATYKCVNSGDNWAAGDILTKTLDQLSPAVTTDLAHHITNGLKMTECVYRPGSSSFFDLVREWRTLATRGVYNPSSLESYYLYETRLGEYGVCNGEIVPLDWPMPINDTLAEADKEGLSEVDCWDGYSPGAQTGIKTKKGKGGKRVNNCEKIKEDDSEALEEAEYKGRKVDLNSPMRSSGPKKYKVYTNNKKGNTIQVNFGDAKGGLSAKLDDDDARANFASRHNCDSKAKEDKTKPGYWSCRLPRYWEDLGLKKNSYRFW